jgi:hypothetical protein
MAAFLSEDDCVVRREWWQVARRAQLRDRPDLAPAAATLKGMPLAEFLIAVTIAAGISMATFAHADRNGSRHATAWGVGAFLAAGLVVPIYIARVWARKRRPGS